MYQGLVTFFSYVGIKSLAIVRKDDAVELVKKNGADKVIVIGKITNADDYAKAVLDANDGTKKKYLYLK